MEVLMRPQRILFDLGNTLLREEEFDAEAGTRHVLPLAHNPRGLSVGDVCELVAELDVDLQGRREESWLEISPFTIHRLVYEPHSVTFDLSFPEVELEFWRAATKFSPTEGVRDLLVALRSLTLPLGVVSNSTFSSRTRRRS
jgi:FMN phosphatase YigB (HAD superfamily)